MSVVNAALGAAFGILLRPFEGLHPLVGLSVVSLLAAVLVLLVFKATSNQEALLAVKRQIHACLFEIRLYNDDFPAIFRAQAEALGWNLRYLLLSLVPLAVMMVPLVLVMAQLHGWYGFRGLAPGETALVKAELRHNDASKPGASLEVPAGLRVETPAVWVAEQGELAWRIRAERPGTYEVRVTVGDRVDTKRIVVSDATTRRSPIRVDSGWLAQLLSPWETPLPDTSPVRSIAVTYPERDIDVFGWGIHWLIVFFVLVIVFAYMLRGLFGVTI
jgi:uncharacterized membrane protein (DUF106 family)